MKVNAAGNVKRQNLHMHLCHLLDNVSPILPCRSSSTLASVPFYFAVLRIPPQFRSLSSSSTDLAPSRAAFVILQ